MTKRFKWGILSPGRIAHQFATAIGGIDDAEIVAVASVTPGRAAEFANQHGINHAFDDYQQLVSMNDIDAVYISSVHSMHADQALACMQANIPVLCEKPITVNSKQLSKLINFSEQTKVFLMEALWTRFLPVSKKVKDWLKQERIGTLKTIESSFGFIADTAVTDRLKNPNLAGGVLLDLGIYPIAMSQYFTQADVADVKALASLSEQGIDEELDVTIQYTNDVTSRFKCSFRENYKNTMRLTGTLGFIEIDAPFWGASKAGLTVDNDVENINVTHHVNGFEYQIRAAMQAIRNNRQQAVEMPLSDSLKNMRVMDEIRSLIGVQYPFE